MTEKSIFETNLELWEKFVNKNMDLMFKTMEKTMEGSRAFQEQVTKAVDRAFDESRTTQDRVSKAVHKTLEGSQSLQDQIARGVNSAIAAQLDAQLAMLKALERQMESLSKRVDELLEKDKPEG